MKPSSAAPKELAKKLKEGLATGHQWWGAEEGGDRYVNLSLLIPDCESLIKILEAPPAMIQRTAAYWYEQEQIDERGFCDEEIPCDSGFSVTHLCDRFRGHGGRCVAFHIGEEGGRKVRRLEHG